MKYFIAYIFCTFLLYASCLHVFASDEQSSINYSDTTEENEIKTRRRKSCLNDFRQCARKTIEEYDDKRGSNARACERWKNNCRIHYPAIFKTIDETTDYKVITKKDFKEFTKLRKEYGKKVKVEKDGDKTITTTTEIDDEGNEIITKTVETIEEVKAKEDDESEAIIKNDEVNKSEKVNTSFNIDNIVIDKTSDTEEKSKEESRDKIEAMSDIANKSFNVNNINTDKIEEKDIVNESEVETETESEQEENFQEENTN